MFSIGGDGALHVLDDADAKGYVKPSRATNRYIPGSDNRRLRSASSGEQAQRKKLLGTREQLSSSLGGEGGGRSVLLRHVVLSSNKSGGVEKGGKCGDGVRNSAVPPKSSPLSKNITKTYDSFEVSYAAGQMEERDRLKGGVASASREAVACHYGGISQGIRGEGSGSNACGDKDASINGLQRRADFQARITSCLPLPTSTCLSEGHESTDSVESAQASRWGTP